MGHKYVPWALRVDGISRNARYLLVVMTEAAWNSNATLDISLERLAVTAHYSKKSTGAVWKLVQELVAAGHISKRGKADGSGNQVQNTYTVHWKEWGERPDTASQEKAPTSTAQGVTTSQEKRHHLSGEETPPLRRGETTSQERNVTRDQVLPDSNQGEGVGDSFKEWIELFPSSKRRNVRDARAKYAETIRSTDHGILMDSTRAYLDHEQQNEGGKYIGQALAVLTDRRWEKHKPKPDRNLLNIEIQRLNRDRIHAPNSEQWKWETEMIEMEEQKLIDRQGYTRGADGNLRKPELTPEQKKARADSLRRNEYLRYA